MRNSHRRPETPRRPRQPIVLIALLLAALCAPLALSSPVAAASDKLNGPLAIGGQIVDFVISSDGSRVVYLADQTTGGIFELYSVELPMGSEPPATPVKLNGPLTTDGEVVDFAVSSDSDTVVYLASQNEVEKFELFSVPIVGGTVQPLSGLIVEEGDVRDFVISPDGSTVVYRADRAIVDEINLYSVPIGGGTSALLNNPANGEDVADDYAIANDNSGVVYRGIDFFGDANLYSVPLTGGSDPEQLNAPTGSSTVRNFAINPDSTFVAFLADETTNNQFELYRVNIAGVSAPETVNPALDSGGSVREDFAWSANSELLAFRVDGVSGSNPIGQVQVWIRFYNLFNAVIPVSSEVNAANEEVSDFAFSDDGSYIVYRADAYNDNVFELVSVQVGDFNAGDFLVQNQVISGGLPPGTTFIDNYEISPSGTRVIFTGDISDDSDFITQLYSSPIAGTGATVRLNRDLPPDGFVFDFQITPNSQRVLYVADQDSFRVFELYSVGVSGGTPVKLNDEFNINGDVFDFAISPNSQRVVYGADPTTAGVFNLFAASTTVSGQQVQLTDTQATAGDVVVYELAPDGTRAVYLANEDTSGIIELYSVTLGNNADSIKLNLDLPPTANVFDFVISPDSQTVVYIAEQDTAGVAEIYSVPIDGSSDPVKLNTPLVAGGQVYDFEISSNSQRVVYKADQEFLGNVDLYSVPIDGSSDPVRLSSIFTLGGFISQFVISPNSERVVYIANQDDFDAFELFSVNINGGSPATLNDPLPTNGNVVEFVISPDSSRVVYVADQVTDEVYELRSVPLNDGPTIRLNSAFSGDQDVHSFNWGSGSNCGAQVSGDRVEDYFVAVSSFAVSPNGQRVVYCADPDTDGIFELFSVPLTGGVPVKLNVPPGAFGGIERFEISADSARVIFLIENAPNFDSVFELYSAPLAGGSAPTKLSDEMVDNGNVDIFGITSNSNFVVFSADRLIQGTVELFSTPVDGTGEPNLLNNLLVQDGNVAAFVISPDGSKVAFIADDEELNVFELSFNVIDGGEPASKISDPLVANGDVFDVIVASDSDAVVYHADQDTDSVNEIYETDFTIEEPEPITISFAEEEITVAETDTNAVLEVRLNQAASVQVSVDYAVTGGTAGGSGEDFTLGPGTLVFTAGISSQQIIIPLIDDDLEEGDETIIVTLSNPSGEATLVDPVTATVVITDDESPITDTDILLFLPIIVN
jgi:dipeptidyl aminopeptidase/acylaminoacyl peptidase